MVMKERDEELALFLEMRRREKEREKNSFLSLNNSEEQLSHPLGSNVNGNGGGGGSPVAKIVSALPVRKTAAENFLNSENEKSDYDWLLTPPGTPLFPSLEMESQKTLISQLGMSNVRPVALKTRLANLPGEPVSKSTLALKQQTPSAGVNSSNTLTKRPSSSGGPKSASRPATPTGRPTIPSATKPSRSSTPTSRANLPSVKPAASTVRSSTPTRSTARSLTPTARPSLPASKSTSRSSTPTRRPASSSGTLTATAPSARSSSVTRSAHTTSSVPKSASLTSHIKPAPASSVTKSVPAASSITKPTSTTTKSSVPSRGTSPTVKSRPWKPSEMPGFSLETPPNLRTSLPERPSSASRGRPGAPGSRSSSVEANSNGRPRRQSCSPARSRASSGSIGNGSSIRSLRRAEPNGSDSESPVVIGTKMVERVLGFGRTLSKKSLDMAMRHMDIRRTISGNQRPLMTNVPASSIYSVRSGSTRSRTVSVSDSPLATSSTVSSEPSVNNNSFFIEGSEIDDIDISSERGVSSPTSQRAG
ncbi:putative Arginyl-tRNA--protein transferase [Hibiscus syriacus]|uniref:Arginyl-tRNA--protein transferase n=1 Tax=Hibiscus syriacus TaxID=106335 RepID=A0A6A3B4G1_HIBSY|nr:putative Arginyl-tRNA--protein transferase [Hibiscus syriacus]